MGIKELAVEPLLVFSELKSIVTILHEASLRLQLRGRATESHYMDRSGLDWVGRPILLRALSDLMV